MLLAGGLFLLAWGTFDVVLKTTSGWEAGYILLFFGITLATYTVWKMRDIAPQIVIDEQGICLCNLNIGSIPWGEIVGASIQSKGKYKYKYLYIDLRYPDN